MILSTVYEAPFWLQRRQPGGFSCMDSQRMCNHSFSNRSCETTSLCPHTTFSPSSAPSVVFPHLGLFETCRYRPICLYRRLLCPIPQAKKGPKRPTFSPVLFFIWDSRSPSPRAPRSPRFAFRPNQRPATRDPSPRQGSRERVPRSLEVDGQPKMGYKNAGEKKVCMVINGEVLRKWKFQ